MKDKEERIARAVAYFKEGYNCSQSVVAAFADLYGFTHEQALHISASFGGGIAACGSPAGRLVACSSWWDWKWQPWKAKTVRRNRGIMHRARACRQVQSRKRFYNLRRIVGIETGCTGKQPGRSPYGGLLCQASLSEDGRVGCPHFC